MKTSDFDYQLPNNLIAQFPLADRSSSRLMVLHKASSLIEHKHFTDILTYLKAGDVLVLNDTKVILARLLGIKLDTKAHIECLILKIGQAELTCMVKKAKIVKVGTILDFGEGRLQLKCIEVLEEGIRRFSILTEGIFLEILNELGIMPLPPYIKAKLKDPDRYQTVYAKNLGSVAAPTAGLHFTPELIKQLIDSGIIITYVTLHVGLATFKPVEAEIVEEHQMHSEVYEVTQNSADSLNQAKKDQRRIIAIGTTSLRTLESQIQKFGSFKAEMASTSIFIYPGQTIASIDGLITNFHLPKSTLLMLVSALTSVDLIQKAYQIAIEKEYRFFSFGDAMLILCKK